MSCWIKHAIPTTPAGIDRCKICSHRSPSGLIRWQPAAMQTQATAVAVQTVGKLRHLCAVRTCTIDSNTFPKHNKSPLLCGDEYLLFEIKSDI
jgi:hypothetical protein